MTHRSLALIFIALITLLIALGFIFIYSSSSVFALEKFGMPHYFVKKQCIGLIVGLVGLIVCRFIPLSMLQRYAPALFFLSLFLTTLTLLPFATTIHGSRRWLILSYIGFQPSELLKLSLVLYAAYLLTKKRHYLSSLLYGYIPLLLIVGTTAFVLLQQPDFGLMVVLSVTLFLLFFIAHAPGYHLLITSISLLPLMMFLIYKAPYRFNRILNFINPWKDPQGAGFQIIQSFIAIGSGSVAGVGIAQSKQKFFYLPMQHTDFIFSIIAEETGFLGASFLILLYVCLLFIGIKIALKMTDSFRFFTVTGYIVLLNIQTVVNLGVVTGLLPTKGIGLPFVSYGNSALIVSLCIGGIILNCLATESTSS